MSEEISQSNQQSEKVPNNQETFSYGLKRGLPIAVGYLSVSFTFGMLAVSGGIPVWLAVFISLSNLTSAGQFAGTNLIIQGAGLFEIGLTTFVINIRYILMSLSLSQKIPSNTSTARRMLISYGITDETFSVASSEKGKVSPAYMAGLILGPTVGWTLGTLLGGLICSTLPPMLQSAMGIALYGMFIAIIIPPMKKSRAVIVIVLIAVGISCLIKYIPGFSEVSGGFRVIISTIAAAGCGALLFPIHEEVTE